jgi:predicted RNA-binding Zn ribbon-like protein
MVSGPDRFPFEFGGRLCLDFTWTLRYRAVHPTELLTTTDRLGEWLTVIDLPTGRVTRGHLEAARQLREAIYAAAMHTINDTPIHPSHVAVINEWASAEHANPHLHSDGTRTLTVQRGHETHAGLAALACDAIDLISLSDNRLRRCQGPSCSLLFHDTSRPGTRRWCSAERCGNKINTKNYRARLD